MLRNNLYTVREVSNFCKNDYNLAENTKILAKSIFCSSANFGPLVTTDGALESATKGSLFWVRRGQLINLVSIANSGCLGGEGVIGYSPVFSPQSRV